MAMDFKTLIGVAFDIKQAQSELDRQIKSLQKSTKLALEIELSDKEAKKAINDSSKMWSNYRKEAVAAITAPNSELQKMAKHYKDLDKNIISQNKLADSMGIIKNRADGASQSFQAYIKNLKPQAVKNYASEINNISDSFTKASESGKSIDLSKANSQLSKFKSEMKNAGMETASFTSIIKQNISAFTNWYLIGGAVSSLVRNFKSALGSIKEVDTYLTEISKTSEISAENLKKLGIDAFDYASKYGSTVGAYLSGVQEMSRAGYDENIAKGLAELSILAQSAGDMTDELANEYLIATNAAYKYEGNIQKLNDVLDSQNQVTNRNAITMSKLAEATKIAGSQAASSGVEVDELTAAITTMGVVTQAEGGVLGRAFKGILMNLQQVSGEIDGEIINEESFTKVEKATDALGVKLKEVRDGVLSLRDPMQILKELADEYSKLAEGDIRGANLISALGGKYRGNQLSALLDNFDMYTKVLDDYKNASGSAADEAQKTADSIEGRLNQLSNTWNRTVANVVDSDLIKGLTSTSTNVIDLVDKLNLLQTALIALGGFGTFKFFTGFIPMIKNAITSTIAFGNALNAVKTKGFVADATNLSNAIKGLTLSQASAVLSTKTLSKEIIYATLTQAGFSKQEAKTTASTLTMATAQNVATTSTLGLGASFKALGTAMMANPIGLIITGITVAISALSFGMSKYKQAQEEAIATSKQITDKYKQENQAIDEQINKYKELQKQLNDSNISTSEAKNIKDQLYTIQTNLIDSYGLEAEGLDLVNGKYQEQLDILNEVSKKKAEDYLAINKASFEDAKKAISKERTYNIGNLGTANDLTDYLSNYVNDAVKLIEYDGYFDLVVHANVEEADKSLYQLYNDIEQFGKDTGLGVESILTSISTQLNKTWTDELKTHKDNYNAYIDAQVIANDTLRPLYKESIDAVEAYNKALASGEGIEEAKSNLDGLRNKVAQNTSEVEGSQRIFDSIFSKIATGSQQAGKEIENSFTFPTDQFNTLNKSLDDLDKKSKDTVSSVKELNQVLYDQSQGTKLTSEQAYKLITQYPQLASVLEKTTDGYVINEEAINNVREALIEQETANATAQLNMTTDTLNAVKDRVEAYGIELEAITSISSAIAEQKKLSLNETFGTMEGWSFDDASKRITTPTGSFVANATATEYDSIKKAYEEQKLINDTIGKMGNLQERINGLQNDLLSDKGFGVNEGKGGSGSGKEKDLIKEAFDSKKNEIDHLLAMDDITQDEYYKRLEKLNNKYFGKNKKTHLEQYRQYVAEVYKGRKKIDEDNIKSKFDALSHSFAMGDIKSEDKYQKQRWNLAKKYYKNNEGYLDEWKKAQEEWYKWNLDKAEESAKKQEKIAENLKDKYTDLISDIADEIKNEKDKVLDGLEETHKSTIKNLEEQKDSYKEIVKTQLDLLDAKKKQNDYEKSIANKTKEISKIESRKAELEKAAKSGDRTAIAELSKLNEDLSKKKEDLLDEQSDHEYDLQKESLNNALDLNDKLMDAKIDAEKLRFETQKSNIEKLYDKEIELINKAAQYTKEEFGKALDGIATQLASNGIIQSSGSLGSIKNSQSFIADSQINTSTSNRSAILSILRNGQGKDYEDKASALAAYTRDNYGAPMSKAQAVQVAKLLGVSGISSVSDLTGNDVNKNKILEALRKAGFAKGDGIVLDDKMIKQAGEHRIILGRVGEGLLNEERMTAIRELTKAMPLVKDLVKLNQPNFSNITNKTNSPNISIPITIQGNATPSTVSALNNAGNDIVKKIMYEVNRL